MTGWDGVCVGRTLFVGAPSSRTPDERAGLDTNKPPVHGAKPSARYSYRHAPGERDAPTR